MKNSLKILFGVYILAFFVIIFMMVLTIFNERDLRGIESNVVYTIQLILNDNNKLYQHPVDLPFNITQYSPFYYVLCDGFLSVLKIDVNDYYSIRIYTRLVTILLLILSLLILNSFLKEKYFFSTKERFIICTAYIILSFPWYSISRPDVLVLLFLISAIYLLKNYFDRKKLIFVFWAGGLLSLSVASKLNGTVFILITVFFFLINKNWKAIFSILLGFCFGLMLFSFLLFSLGYKLNYIKENIIDGVNNGLNFEVAFANTYYYFFTYFSTFLIISILFIKKNLFLMFKQNYNSYNFYLALCCLLTFIYSMITSLKFGSAVNYFNEFLILFIIFISVQLKESSSKYHTKFTILLLVTGLHLALSHFFFYSSKFTKIHNLVGKDKVTPGTMEVLDYLNSTLKSDLFYSNDRHLNLSFPLQCLLFPSDIHYLTYQRDIYDYSIIKKYFSTGKIKYIIDKDSSIDLYGIDLKKHFVFNKKIGDFNIYITKY